jgi:hypothetical protein
MITHSRAHELLKYDPATGEFTWRVANSNRVKVGALAGNKSGRYLVIGIDGREYRAQRLAWLLSHGKWPDGVVDHENGNSFDNRLTNLRDATQRQNLGNARRAEHNKSGVKGVHWDNARQRWHAQISENNKSKSLGRFVSIEDAAAAYEVAARASFGAFARIA